MAEQDQNAALKEFLARHVKAYDPATDDYECQPFAADIKEGKNDPIYNAHSYHTKVPPRSIVPYILHYTKPGDVVLDLFCGSGMTGVAAQMCANPPEDILNSFPELKDRVGNRTCILNDLSPAACHIAYNYNTPVDVEELKREFERIKAAVQEEFAWLYGTEHYQPAVELYDTKNPEVASRLKNPPGGKTRHNLLEETERTWELLTKSEVEDRLGYPVTELPRDDDWGKIDVAKVKHWVCMPAMIQYTIWSDVYKCEGFITVEEPTGKVSTRGKNAGKPLTTKSRVSRGCGGEINLWNVAVDDPTGDVAEDFSCAHCSQRWTKYDLDYIRAEPVFVAVDFQRPNGSNTRKYRKISVTERERVAVITSEPVPHWYPDESIYPYRELMSMGVTKHGVARISDFYTRRNLRALARLWSETKGMKQERALKFVLTSMFGRIERTTRYKFRRGGNSSLSGLLYIGSITVEDNILRQLETKLRQVADGLGRLAENYHDCSSFVNCGSADELSWLSDSSVDYIFTDPPFGGNIFYADASMLYEAWLGQATNVRKEMVYHRRSKQQRERDGYVFKCVEDYENDMGGAFKEMFRVLKPGRWATIEFNNSDGTVFEAIKRGVRAAGFEIVNMLLLDKQQKTFKQLQGAEGNQDVVDKDVLFNLHKPALVRVDVLSGSDDLEQQLAEAVRLHLQNLPERIKAEPGKYSDEHRTTSTINSMLMNVLIPRGVSVGRLNLPFIERVCSRYFRKVGQYWYLRGEAVGGNGGTLLQEEVAVKDELTGIAWLRQKLAVRPMLIGELKPLWMRATGLMAAAQSQAVVLETLLVDNFWRDPESNRWREPTDEERERINDDRSLRVLHDADRFVSGTFSRTPSNRELCEWMKVLFDTCRDLEEGGAEVAQAHAGFEKMEGYELIVKLSHRLMKDGLEPAIWSGAQKQAKVAGQRLAAAAETGNTARVKAPKDDKQTLLEI